MFQQHKPISRKQFLDYVLQGSVGVFTIGIIAPILSYLYPSTKHNGNEDEIEVSEINSVAIGEGLKFDYKGQPSILVRTSEGFFALSATCTHLACIINWDKEKQQLVCPCHNAAFDVRGNVLIGPPPKPLASLRVDIRDNKIIVAM